MSNSLVVPPSIPPLRRRFGPFKAGTLDAHCRREDLQRRASCWLSLSSTAGIDGFCASCRCRQR